MTGDASATKQDYFANSKSLLLAEDKSESLDLWEQPLIEEDSFFENNIPEIEIPKVSSNKEKETTIEFELPKVSNSEEKETTTEFELPKVSNSEEKETTTEFELPKVSNSEKKETTTEFELPKVSNSEEKETTTEFELPKVSNSEEKETTIEFELPKVSNSEEKETTTEFELPKVSNSEEKETTIEFELPKVSNSEEKETTIEFELPKVSNSEEKETTTEFELPKVSNSEEKETTTEFDDKDMLIISDTVDLINNKSVLYNSIYTDSKKSEPKVIANKELDTSRNANKQKKDTISSIQKLVTSEQGLDIDKFFRTTQKYIKKNIKIKKNSKAKRRYSNFRKNNEKPYIPYSQRNTKHNYLKSHTPTLIYKKRYNKMNRHLPKAQYTEDFNKLIFHVIENDDIDSLRPILKKVSGIDVLNKDGETPLLFAARLGKVKSLKYLLFNGADVNAQNKQGITALHYAAANNRSDILNAILKADYDKDIADNNGYLPYHYALHNNMLGNIDKIGYDNKEYAYKAINEEGNNALFDAVISEDFVLLQYFAHKNVNFDSFNQRGLTPLMIASYHNNYLVAQELIKRYQVDIHKQDIYNRTAYDLALLSNAVETANLLLDTNNNYRGSNNNGYYTTGN